jgi:hypothetical protein
MNSSAWLRMSRPVCRLSDFISCWSPADAMKFDDGRHHEDQIWTLALGRNRRHRRAHTELAGFLARGRRDAALARSAGRPPCRGRDQGFEEAGQEASQVGGRPEGDADANRRQEAGERNRR